MKYRFETASAESISTEQHTELEKWFLDYFGQVPYDFATPDWFITAREEGILAGRVGIIERTVSVKGQTIPIGGITGLITDPEKRKLGIAKALMDRAIAFMADELGVRYGFLLCREEIVTYYERLGWTVAPGQTSFDQKDGKRIWPKRTMVLGLKGDSWPEGPIDLCGLPW